MRGMIVLLIYGCSEAVILDFLTCQRCSSELQTKKARSRRRLIFLLYSVICAGLKLYFEYNEIIYTICFTGAMIGLLLIIRRTTRLSWFWVVSLFFLNILISLAGDAAVIAALRFGLGFQKMPKWDEPGGMGAIIASNFLQMLIVCGYACLMGREKMKHISVVKKGEEHKIEQLSDETARLPLFLILISIGLLLMGAICYSFAAINYDFVFCIFFAMHVILAGCVIWMMIASGRDEELRNMQRQTEILEQRNREIYRHYEELELSSRRLHRLRHDFNNQLNAACGLAKNGDIDKAEKLFLQMELLLTEGMKYD